MTPSNYLRVVSDNDYAGDPDGLVQLAHLLLCKTVETRLVISSHLRHDVPWPVPDLPAAEGARLARELAISLNSEAVSVVAGQEQQFSPGQTGESEASVRLLEEFHKQPDQKLYYLCGGPLTTLAAALEQEPAMAKSVHLIWIGGHGYDPQNPETDPEFNTWADIEAARLVFEHLETIWQVPKTTYANACVSAAEFSRELTQGGPAGKLILERYEEIHTFAASIGLNLGEIHVLGDSPVVLLTALQNTMEKAPTSCEWIDIPRRAIGSNGLYGDQLQGLTTRVITNLDVRLMVTDFYEKLKAHSLL